MTTTDRIKSHALSLGFTKVGIAAAETLTEETKHLEEWLQRGNHATMDWMNRNLGKRADPSLIVPGAKSVIAVALNYYTDIPHTPESGKISRYAWGDDYHVILKEKLKTLHSWMQREFSGYNGRYYVDTGPVMEKVWAQRSGIGWIGKHTNVITQDIGSWVFLGEIITTLELRPDTPATDHCGSCTLCIEACPTGAITEPYVVDSNRCLSYLTIEHHGEIKGDVTHQFDGWIYGCDVCQDVCPWNEKFGMETEDTRFRPREWNKAPKLDDWKCMDQEEFSAKFKGSPMKRTKREGLVRNVRIALDEKLQHRGTKTQRDTKNDVT